MIRKEGHDAKHQMKLHFLITPDPYIFPAKFFFQPAVALPASGSDQEKPIKSD